MPYNIPYSYRGMLASLAPFLIALRATNSVAPSDTTAPPRTKYACKIIYKNAQSTSFIYIKSDVVEVYKPT